MAPGYKYVYIATLFYLVNCDLFLTNILYIRDVFRGGAGGHSPPLELFLPPLEFPDIKKMLMSL